jgi:hypothetical protein
MHSALCTFENLKIHLHYLPPAHLKFLSSSTDRQYYLSFAHQVQRTSIKPGSSVSCHIKVCKPDFAVKNLAHEHDPINLRLKEAIIIRDLAPQLNFREEL